MEQITDPKEVRFMDDGLVVVVAGDGEHVAWRNGDMWLHGYFDAQGRFVGQINPEHNGGPEGVQEILRGERPLPNPTGAVADTWFDLGTLRRLTNPEDYAPLIVLEPEKAEDLGRILWQALALCAISVATKKKERINPLAMIPWPLVDDEVKRNYRQGALELLKFFSFNSKCNISFSEITETPPWQEVFPLENAAPPGLEAHTIFNILLTPSTRA